jgi:hypothetical protein
MSRRFLLLVFIALLASGVFGIGRNVTLSDRIENSRSAGVYADGGTRSDRVTTPSGTDHRVSAISNDFITIEVDAGFDAYVELYSPAGPLLVSDDDSGWGTNALISNFRIPVTGEYRINVKGLGGTIGYYTLTWSLFRQQTTNPQNGQAAVPTAFLPTAFFPTSNPTTPPQFPTATPRPLLSPTRVPPTAVSGFTCRNQISRFKQGDVIVVDFNTSDTNANQARLRLLRRYLGDESDTMAQAYNDERLQLLEEPVCHNGQIFWYVGYQKTRTQYYEGWALEYDRTGNPYMCPTNDAECRE